MRVLLPRVVLTALAGCQKAPPSCFDLGPLVTAAKFLGLSAVASSIIWSVAICWRKGRGG